MSRCFFGATDENLSKPEKEMGACEISIQLQRVLTFGDAFSRALSEHVDKPHSCCARAWSGTDDKALVSLASASAKADIGAAPAYANTSARAEPTSASTLPGSAARERSKKLRACAALSGV